MLKSAVTTALTSNAFTGWNSRWYDVSLAAIDVTNSSGPPNSTTLSGSVASSGGNKRLTCSKNILRAYKELKIMKKEKF